MCAHIFYTFDCAATPILIISRQKIALKFFAILFLHCEIPYMWLNPCESLLIFGSGNYNLICPIVKIKSISRSKQLMYYFFNNIPQMHILLLKFEILTQVRIYIVLFIYSIAKILPPEFCTFQAQNFFIFCFLSWIANI